MASVHNTFLFNIYHLTFNLTKLNFEKIKIKTKLFTFSLVFKLHRFFFIHLEKLFQSTALIKSMIYTFNTFYAKLIGALLSTT